jgi:putative oxidoreductase
MNKDCCKQWFQPTGQPKKVSMALLLLRLVAGTAFMFHGWGKMQAPMSWMGPEAPVPGIFQFLAAFSEFGGGLAWVLGLLTPLASLGLAITMAVATGMHMFVMKDPFVASGPGMGSYEPALMYFCISLLLMNIGAGKYSMDSKIFGIK